MTLLILYLLIALVFSFLCSIGEAVLLTVRPSYVAALGRSGARGGKTWRTLKDDIDRPLAAILTVNTIAHTVGAAGVGAQAAHVFGDAYLGITSGVLTLLILVLSEIIPKSLGAIYWRQLAVPAGAVILWTTRLLAPAVWMSQKITKLFAGGKDASAFAREEVEAMAALGAEEGELDEHQYRVVRNLLGLSEHGIREIMTPRPVIYSRSAATTVGEYVRDGAENAFSRFPIYGENPDDVTGYVLKGDLLLAHAKGEDGRPIGDFRRDFVVVPEFQSVLDVLSTMLERGEHLVLVLNEYGTVQGLVSQEDVFETLLGLEITDETDLVTDMQALARRLSRSKRRALEETAGKETAE